MGTTYIWRVKNLEWVTFANGFNNVVSTIEWECTAKNDKKNQKTSARVTLVFDQNAPFINYEDLTELQVIEWVKNALGSQEVDNIQNNLNTQLMAPEPPKVGSGLPWKKDLIA
jgi:hypothetical protein